MNPRKVLDEFRLWALWEPVVRNELAIAKDEFFAFHDPAEMESLELVQGLFLEWFLFDRKLTSWLKTPAELYLKFPKTRLKKSVREIAESLTRSIFGLFEVLEARPQEDCLEIKHFGNDERWTVRDVAGSRSMKNGDILFTRLIPCPGIALLSGWCAGYPGHQKEFRETTEQTRRKLGHVPLFHPRDVLNLFVPRIRWEDRGPEVCRGKLVSLWQQAVPKKFSWKEFEVAVGSANEKSFRDGLAALCDVLTSSTKAELALEVAWAWWNMTAGRTSGELTPFEKTGGIGAGPLERRFLMRSMDVGRDKIRQTGEPPSPEEIDSWMSNPANGEEGHTPKELIIQERRRLGHPAPERVAYRLSVEKLDALSARMSEAADRANQATDLMRKGNFSEALTLYEKAWLALKDEPTHHYRILGNMATCHAFLGRRQEAIRCLESALKANPDYTLARGNLLRLQTMTDEQYAEFRQQGVRVMREV